MNFSIHQASHIGNRRFNQDRVAYAYTSEALLLVLADGMGGHLHGELAAALAITVFIESFGRHAQPRVDDPGQFLMKTMRNVHERILRFPHDKDLGGFPGTTCVAVLIQDNTMYSGHAGDSRMYLLRDGKVLTRTSDHSVVQHWVESGQLTPDEARVHPQRNHITNCLGGVEDLFYMEQSVPIALKPGDTILLASDGLWGPFTDRELVEAFFALPVAEVLDKLLALALKREAGTSDNITGLAVRWGGSEIAHANAEPISHILEIS